MRRIAAIRAYPPWYWDAEASRWDAIVGRSTNPHQFYYLEADRHISALLKTSMRALELACGTGGSTAAHHREVSELVATDFSEEMVRRAAHRRHQGNVHFAAADASCLPFRDGTFDVVFSRGVLLSYVPDPGWMLREAYRVLRPGGRLALDAMNRLGGNPRKRSGLFCLVGGRPAYAEYLVRAGLQIRWIHWLSEDSPLVARARVEERPESRPRDLRDHVTSVERFEGRLFRPRELSRLVQEAGFEEVKVAPLGHFAYTLGFSDKTVREFARKNRRDLSKLYVQLASHFRLDTAWHLFISAARR